MQAKHHPHVVFVRTALEKLLCELKYFNEESSRMNRTHPRLTDLDLTTGQTVIYFKVHYLSNQSVW